jgi:hypothetical protein
VAQTIHDLRDLTAIHLEIESTVDIAAAKG